MDTRSRKWTNNCLLYTSIIALGSDLPVVAETACELYKAGYGEKLMFCGGIGHSTVNLKKKVAKILNVETDQLPESEAAIYACLAKDKYQIESSSIFMDKTSTNTLSLIHI